MLMPAVQGPTKLPPQSNSSPTCNTYTPGPPTIVAGDYCSHACCGALDWLDDGPLCAPLCPPPQGGDIYYITWRHKQQVEEGALLCERGGLDCSLLTAASGCGMPLQLANGALAQYACIRLVRAIPNIITRPQHVIAHFNRKGQARWKVCGCHDKHT